MSDSAVSVQHLSKGFHSHVVLDDVSFEIPAGHTFALPGRNGAGKTTIIRTLPGLLPADKGTIEVGLRPCDSSDRIATSGRLPCGRPVDVRVDDCGGTLSISGALLSAMEPPSGRRLPLAIRVTTPCANRASFERSDRQIRLGSCTGTDLENGTSFDRMAGASWSGL